MRSLPAAHLCAGLREGKRMVDPGFVWQKFILKKGDVDLRLRKAMRKPKRTFTSLLI